MQEILKGENELTGCMVGRMAMNNTWEIAAMDKTFYSDKEQGPLLTREEIMRDYAEFAQNEQNKEVAKGGKLSNTILIRPLINMFCGEFKGADFRKKMNQWATNAKYKNNVKQLIIDGIDYYRTINYEGLASKEGDRVWRPTKLVEEELLLKQEKFGNLK